MATIQEIKDQIDLHDLAEKLGLERPQRNGNYRSPHHKDSNPSLEIKKDGKRWRDYSTDAGGSCVDLVCYVEGIEVGEALKRLHELYGIPFTRTKGEDPRPKSLAEKIAGICIQNADIVKDYLRGRGITDEVISRAIQRKAVGFNTWNSTKVQAGEFGYGGPAAAFIVRTLNPGHIVAVDMRYLDPALNGGTKTQCQGEKDGYPFVMDLARLLQAKTVYVVESPINAMSIESCDMPYTAAIATRGISNVKLIDWRFLQGKQVISAMDNDKPDEKNRSPGREAAWSLHEILMSLNITCMLVDQDNWEENDVNDILKEHGVDELRQRMKKLDGWLIPGLPGNLDLLRGRTRVFLPPQDYAQYWRFRLKEDYTSYITKYQKDDTTGEERHEFEPLSGFRVAGISRVSISGAVATMTGDPDTQPKTLYALTVQAPRHGLQLQRRVIEDEALHNPETWKKFGPVFKPSAFLRMINILERTVHFGERKAVNFVGLAWRDGKTIVNEGPDCYFTDPEKQCPYHNLTFPSGSVSDARIVIDAYQETFQHNAATAALVWALGGHLKAFLGFWPHMIMQADKGAGKSTLIKRLERTVAFTMFSGQSLQTEFRLLTSISHTSHPVGWEEISARRQDIIDRAVGLLQEAYNYSPTKRGSDMTEYLVSAPVLMAGEDVPVKSLLGKVVRTDLTGRKGPIMPDNLPRFPVREWLAFLAGYSRQQILQLYNDTRQEALGLSMADKSDDGGIRMAGNYSAIVTAWRLLCEFTGLPKEQGGFIQDIVREMNRHISETEAEREPWVWIVEMIIAEIDAGNFRYPYTWSEETRQGSGELTMSLVLRVSNIIDHISQSMALRDKWNALPVKSAMVLRRQMQRAGVIVNDRVDATVRGKRYSHMVAISVEELGKFGLRATPDDSADR